MIQFSMLPKLLPNSNLLFLTATSSTIQHKQTHSPLPMQMEQYQIANSLITTHKALLRICSLPTLALSFKDVNSKILNILIVILFKQLETTFQYPLEQIFLLKILALKMELLSREELFK